MSRNFDANGDGASLFLPKTGRFKISEGKVSSSPLKFNKASIASSMSASESGDSKNSGLFLNSSFILLRASLSRRVLPTPLASVTPPSKTFFTTLYVFLAAPVIGGIVFKAIGAEISSIPNLTPSFPGANFSEPYAERPPKTDIRLSTPIKLFGLFLATSKAAAPPVVIAVDIRAPTGPNVASVVNALAIGPFEACF